MFKHKEPSLKFEWYSRFIISSVMNKPKLIIHSYENTLGNELNIM